jgi:hypothetical protein
MINDICESCGLPAAPHNVTDCFKELVHKRKRADDMFDAAIKLIHYMEDPVTIKDEKLSSLVVDLDLTTWRYAT